MSAWVEEAVILIIVTAALPIVTCAWQRLTGKRIHNKLMILLAYLLIFYIALEIYDRLQKDSNDLPPILTGQP